MDYIVHRVAKSQTRLSDFQFFSFVIDSLCAHKHIQSSADFYNKETSINKL